MGVVTAAGSFGQFLLLPFTQALISSFGWYAALLVLAAIAALIIPLSPGLAPIRVPAPGARSSRSARRSARRCQRSFHFLFWSYFVCGVHTAFMALHLPSLRAGTRASFAHRSA